MPDTSTSDDLLAAVSNLFRGDRTTGREMLAGIQQRAEVRVRDKARGQLDALLSPGSIHDSNAFPPRPIAAPRPIPRPGRERPVEVTLQNGHRLRAVLAPAVARRRDLDAIARVSAANDREAFTAIRRQSEALGDLKRSQEELARKIAALEMQADRTVVGLLKGIGGLEQRVKEVTAQGQALLSGTGRTTAPAARQAQQLQTLAETAQIQNVTNVVNSVQATAYGQRGSILATNNLLLAGNQLFWNFLGPIARNLGLADATSSLVLAYLAPLGSLVTGQILLGNRQHVRFISGVETFDGKQDVVVVSLRSRIADGLWQEFQRRTDVPVATSALLPSDGSFFTGTVVGGVLRIESPDITPAAGDRVAWTVDTGADVG